MTWQELQQLVCGDSDFKVGVTHTQCTHTHTRTLNHHTTYTQVESLQKIAVYEGGFNPFSPQVVFLWDTLRMFDANQR